MTPEFLATLEKRFWSKVDKRGPDDCWPWVGTRLATGYGRLKAGGRQLLASRLVLHLTGRSLEAGEFACHHCDNPSCVNPAHLFVGTRSDNMLDMYAKGRRRQGGSSNPRARLTPEQVHAIRSRTDSLHQLAREFGVRHTTIHAIRIGKSWKDVR